MLKFLLRVFMVGQKGRNLFLLCLRMCDMVGQTSRLCECISLKGGNVFFLKSASAGDVGTCHIIEFC